MRRTLALLVVLPSVLVGLSSPASAASGQKAASGQTITLITGDVITLSKAGDKTAATVQPGPGREQITFHTIEADGGLRVLPSDAVPAVSDGRVDADLFDVERLVADGYGDAATPTLPLIVTAPAGVRATAQRSLPSLGASAIRAQKASLASFWTGARTKGKVWLDGKVRARLDRSAAQIGAPEAWKSGLDGRGVKVAVLDTGVDAKHPDLAGKVAATHNFSDSPDVVDRFGHGTHVAATVAGSGAGSNGLRKGIAYGAELLIGKVLGDDGWGQESALIEGMQWAADSGAKVVNMSLGGEPSDGTDPLSAAVDEISARTGTLFVVAAGNEGQTSTVEAPGAANSALTVGAVDRDEKLAEFSSRGPRVGDLALKPEITAPGVDIVAARAAGTTMGDPLDAFYTAASGTSMATPHVAGAAAVLAQQHPDWTGARLKDALVSSARTADGINVYGQGAGRVDLARATRQTVRGTGIADFGPHHVGDTEVLERTVTYTNDGPQPVTLSIARPAELDGPATVTVPAHGSQGTSFKLALPTLKPGRHSGWIVATGPGGERVTTAFGAFQDAPTHRVTIRALNRGGKPGSVPVLTMMGDDERADVYGYFGSEGRTFEVAEGEYLLHALLQDNDPQFEQATLFVNPELKVDRDMTVVLDARTANPIRIETPQPAEQQAALSYYVHRDTGGGRSIAHGVMHFSTIQQVNVTPTKPVKSGSFEFASRWTLVEPDVRASAPGVAGPLRINLRGTSPVFPGVRSFPLVKWGAPNVRGKAVLFPDTLGEDEETLIRRAHDAGAAVAMLERGAGSTNWTVLQPAGDRLPLPTLVVANPTGERLLARAARPGATIQLKLTVNSPYLYDVLQVSPKYVPEHIVYRVSPSNSQRIVTSYPNMGGFDWVREQRFGWRPWQDFAWNDYSRPVQTSSTRVEWVSAGDSLWQHRVLSEYPALIGQYPLKGGFADVPHSVRPGTSTESWASPVVRPATPAGYASTRTGDVLKLRVADAVDADGHGSFHPSTAAELRRDGQPLATPANGWQDVTTTPGDAVYELTVRTAPGSAEWTYGTRTDTTWRFRSKAGDTTLPLLQIRYTTRGSVAPIPGAKIRVEQSSDDGATWRSFVSPAAGVVSLRVTATDRDGNSVTQTVIRAFGNG